MQLRASLRSHARAAAALLLALAAATAGCAPQLDDAELQSPDEQIRPPGQLAAEIMQSADAVAEPPFEIRRVDAAFAEAVEEYGLFVQRLVTSPLGGTDDQRRTALVLLARALERTPGAGAEARAAADRITRAALETPGERGRQDILGALSIAAATLLELARGPYASAPEVYERVQELQQGVSAGSQEGAPLSEADLNKLLRRAEFALKAIHATLGKGGAPGEAPASPAEPSTGILPRGNIELAADTLERIRDVALREPLP